MQTVTAHSTTVVAQPLRNYFHEKAIRGLGITQIIIGSFTLLLGTCAMAVLSYDYWLQKSGGGIWGGLWILVAGIIGLISSYKQEVGSLNGLNMAFNIIGTVIAFLDGIFFAVGLGYYNNCQLYTYYYNYNYYYYYNNNYYNQDAYSCYKDRNAGRGLYATLMLLMFVEFFIALVNAIYCCQSVGACCSNSTTGVVIQQQQQQQPSYITTSSTAQPILTAPISAGYITSTQYAYPPQNVVLQQHYVAPQQPMMQQQSYPPHGATMVTYSSHQQEIHNSIPPPYSQ